MENMINIAEILKDCPKGMELDCTMHEDVVTFYGISNSYIYPILVSTKRGDTIRLTKYGQFFNPDGFKCVIFPKGKTTWEGFQRPFKDGDVVVNSDVRRKALKVINSFESFIEDMKQDDLNILLSYVKNNYDL